MTKLNDKNQLTKNLGPKARKTFHYFDLIFETLKILDFIFKLNKKQVFLT